MSKSSKATNPQKQRFIEAARQLDADENENAFKAKLMQIARQKPKEDVLEPDKDDKS